MCQNNRTRSAALFVCHFSQTTVVGKALNCDFDDVLSQSTRKNLYCLDSFVCTTWLISHNKYAPGESHLGNGVYQTGSIRNRFTLA